MFKLLKKIFKKESQEKETISDINLASAIILIEVSYSDFEIKDVEIEKIIRFFEKDLKIKIIEKKVLNNNYSTNFFLKLFPNLFGEIALYRFEKKIN